MSIDANVAFVETFESKPGCVLHLCDRVDGSRGQDRLLADECCYEVTALNGLPLWGSSSMLMLGERQIARRSSYTRIEFVERDAFLAAVKEYHQRRGQQ